MDVASCCFNPNREKDKSLSGDLAMDGMAHRSMEPQSLAGLFAQVPGPTHRHAPCCEWSLLTSAAGPPRVEVPNVLGGEGWQQIAARMRQSTRRRGFFLDVPAPFPS